MLNIKTLESKKCLIDENNSLRVAALRGFFPCTEKAELNEKYPNPFLSSDVFVKAGDERIEPFGKVLKTLKIKDFFHLKLTRFDYFLTRSPH